MASAPPAATTSAPHPTAVRNAALRQSSRPHLRVPYPREPHAPQSRGGPRVALVFGGVGHLAGGALRIPIRMRARHVARPRASALVPLKPQCDATMDRGGRFLLAPF